MFHNQDKYKPTSAELARATRELWGWFDTARILNDGYRDLNGVELAPGEFSQREIMVVLYDLVICWHERNYGNSGPRRFLANLVQRGLVRVLPSERGKPSRYALADDPETGKPWTEERFCTVAYEARKAAHRPAVEEPSLPRVDPGDYADILTDL